MTTQVKIDISKLNEVNWEAGQTYRISLTQNFVRDDTTTRTASVEVPNLYTVNPENPFPASFSPANGSSGSISSTVQAIYPIAAFKNTGTQSIRVWRVGPPDTQVANIPIGDSRISINGNIVSIDLKDLIDGLENYYILFDGALFTNMYRLDSVDISSSSTWRFTTGNGPLVASTVPAYNTLNTQLTNHLINFDSSSTLVTTATRNLYLFSSQDSQLLATIPTTSTRVSASGTNSVQLNLLGLIDSTTDYHVRLDKGVVRNNQNRFSSNQVVDDSRIKFRTGDGPLISSTLPTYNSTNIQTTTQTIIFDKSVSLVTTSTKNLYVYQQPGNQLISTLPTTNSRVTSIGTNTVRLNLTGIIDADTDYFLTLDKGVVKDAVNQFGSNQISDNSKIKFKTGSGPAVSSTIPTYNSSSVFFSTATINFNQPFNVITTASKNVYVFEEGTNSIVATIPSTSTRITQINTNSIRVSLQDIIQDDKTYQLRVDRGLVKNSITQFSNAEVLEGGITRFTTTKGPQIINLIPANNADPVYNTLFTIEFNKNNLSIGQGQAELRYLGNSSGPANQSVKAWSTTDSQIYLIGNKLFLDFSDRSLPAYNGSIYSLTLDSGFIKDPTTGFDNPAVLNTTTYRFTMGFNNSLGPALTAAPIQTIDLPTDSQLDSNNRIGLTNSYAAYAVSGSSSTVFVTNHRGVSIGSISNYTSSITDNRCLSLSNTDLMLGIPFDKALPSGYTPNVSGEVKIYNPATLQVKATLRGGTFNSSYPNSFGSVISQSASYYAVYSRQYSGSSFTNSVIIYSKSTQAIVRTITVTDLVTEIALDDTNIFILVNDATPSVQMYNISTGNYVREFVRTGSISLSGDIILIGARSYSISTGNELYNSGYGAYNSSNNGQHYFVVAPASNPFTTVRTAQMPSSSIAPKYVVLLSRGSVGKISAVASSQNAYIVTTYNPGVKCDINFYIF